MLSEKDDLRHPHDSDPRWRESLYWNFLAPDALLGGVIYLRLDPNAGVIAPMIMLYRGFEETPAYFYARGEPLRPSVELDDVAVAGLHIQRLAPLQRFSMEFTDGEGTGFELTFTGIHRAFDYATNIVGCPLPMASNRLEQAGRVEGTLQFAGKQLQISGFCQRDHSWGVRDWDAIQHYKWLAVQAGDKLAVNLLYLIFRGEVSVNGYVCDGEHVAPIVHADIETSYGADAFGHRRVAASIIDERRKTTVVEGTMYASTIITLDRSLVVEAAGRFRLDGKSATGVAEYLWPANYVEHVRKYGVTARIAQRSVAH